MAKCFSFFLLFTFCVPSAQCSSCDKHVFNVVDYGAIGNGHADDTEAFENAWKEVCKSRCSTILHVPPGKKFLVQPITFAGTDCKSNEITVQIDGTIVAPIRPPAWECHDPNCKDGWIRFHDFGELLIHGTGTIDGQGSRWWELSCKKNKKLCRRKPKMGFCISESTNVYIYSLTFKDSPQMHIAFENSRWVYAEGLTIQASADSPNTDGIHLQRCKHVFIAHTHIKTGDDCISIGDGTSHVNITNVKCGPGHGISIGSLGRDEEEERVEFIHVSNVEFTGTTNGVRIKTWQGGRGYARNINFEHITCHDSMNPIIIDQYYCPHKHCKDQNSAVHISNVKYTNVTGTSEGETAVVLSCSKSAPCKNIWMKDVNLKSSKENKKTSSNCLNVNGHTKGKIFPSVSCLSEDFNHEYPHWW